MCLPGGFCFIQDGPLVNAAPSQAPCPAQWNTQCITCGVFQAQRSSLWSRVRVKNSEQILGLDAFAVLDLLEQSHASELAISDHFVVYPW